MDVGSMTVIGNRWIKPVKTNQTGFVLLIFLPPCKTHQITIDLDFTGQKGLEVICYLGFHWRI